MVSAIDRRVLYGVSLTGIFEAVAQVVVMVGLWVLNEVRHGRGDAVGT